MITSVLCCTTLLAKIANAFEWPGHPQRLFLPLGDLHPI